jgi:hypothetical protein
VEPKVLLEKIDTLIKAAAANRLRK